MSLDVSLWVLLEAPWQDLLDPSKRIYWPFLLAALALALLMGAWSQRQQGWVGLHEALKGLFSAALWLHPSARLDYKLLVFKATVKAVWTAPAVVSAWGLAVYSVSTLTGWFGLPGPVIWSRLAVSCIYTVVLFLCWDFSRYALHRLMHRVPCLWELHKVHHSAEVLTPFTLYRSHPLETLLFTLRGILVTGLVTGVFFYVFRSRAVQLDILGVNVLGFLFNALGGNLRHSHLRISFGYWLEHLFISPAQHQVHHSAEPRHFDRNYGSWLALWDWLGGSLYVAAGQAQPRRYGLEKADSNHDSYSLISSLLRPMVEMFRPLLAGLCSRDVSAVLVALLLLGAAPLLWAQEQAGEGEQGARAPAAGEAAAPADAEAILIVDAEPDAKATSSKEQKAKKAKKDKKAVTLETVSIFGRPEKAARVAGSAHVIEEEVLERFGYDDVQRVLQQVPGTYNRTEDGYGLRPNIGLRGASSERSAKVTLMEDGILLAPAPYAAPAAYYFPLMARMTGVEVFKGPSAIKHGPNTIGGALNMVGRSIPQLSEGYLELGLGGDLFGKLHSYWALSRPRYGVLVEGVHLQTAGFKELDGRLGEGISLERLRDGGETGFDKNELVLKAHYNTEPGAKRFQRLELTLGYSDELSNETYLGLSEADFRLNPKRRYAATARGRMSWTRTRVQFRYLLQQGEDLKLTATAYRHDFSRSWEKLNRFQGESLDTVLANPDAGVNGVYYAVLTGAQGSLENGPDYTLLVGTNRRDYVSQGLQVQGSWSWRGSSVQHELQFGARFHSDEVDRHHSEAGFLMAEEGMVVDGSPATDTAISLAVARAFALYLLDEISIADRLFITPGLRTELIATELTDQLTGIQSDPRAQRAFIPGLGVYYQLGASLGLLAGVHRGFSPVAPGQAESVTPELSTNYEVGARYRKGRSRAELIAFFNDYSNLTATCTRSTGCSEVQLDEQFSAGSIHVYGLELVVGHRHALPAALQLALNLSYTLTRSDFQSSFTSTNPQLGAVEEGDELAYVPEHQGSLILALSSLEWGLSVSASGATAMRNEAGQGSLAEGEGTDPHLILDALAYYVISESGELYLKADNLLGSSYVAARRPFGARPGKPFQAILGYKHHFGQ